MVGSCGFGYGLACLAFHLQYNLLGTVLHGGFLLLVGSLLRSERYGLGGLDAPPHVDSPAYPLWAVADMLKVEGIYGIYIHNIGIIFGIFSAVVLTAYLLERGVIRVNKFLSDGSFFLYALHALLMLVLARCITKVFFVDSLFYTVALYFIVPCLTTAVSFGLYELLRRYTPRICAVLTGGR